MEKSRKRKVTALKKIILKKREKVKEIKEIMNQKKPKPKKEEDG